MIRNSQVGLQLVGVDGLGLVFDGSTDEVMDCAPLHVRDAFNSDFAAALDGPGNPGLVSFVGPSFTFGLAADQGFVYFDHAEQGRAVQRIISHGLTDAVAEIPSSLVSNSQGAVKLIGRDSLAGFAHEIDRQEPLAEWKVGIVHDGTGSDAELVAAIGAMPSTASRKLRNTDYAAS